MRRFAAIHIFFTALAFTIGPCAITVAVAAPDASVKSTRGEPLETIYRPDCDEISGP
jgi:hypothetical protein